MKTLHIGVPCFGPSGELLSDPGHWHRSDGLQIAPRQSRCNMICVRSANFLGAEFVYALLPTGQPSGPDDGVRSPLEVPWRAKLGTRIPTAVRRGFFRYGNYCFKCSGSDGWCCSWHTNRQWQFDLRKARRRSGRMAHARIASPLQHLAALIAGWKPVPHAAQSQDGDYLTT